MNPDTNDPNVTSNSPVGTTGSTDDLLASLVGEGKKFKTAAELAKGKVEADSFIKKLEDENSALRALIKNSDETRRSTEIMQDLLDRVSKGTLVEQPEGKPTPNTEGQSNQSQPLTSRDVELVYKQMRQQEREDANEFLAMQKLSNVYADKTDEFLEKKSRELGLDVKVLKATARQSPTAFYNLIGEAQLATNKATGGSSAPRGSINSAAVANVAGDSGVRNKKYYDKLRQEKGTRAFVLDRNLQVQMHRDMQSLGDQWDAA